MRRRLLGALAGVSILAAVIGGASWWNQPGVPKANSGRAVSQPSAVPVNPTIDPAVVLRLDDQFAEGLRDVQAGLYAFPDESHFLQQGDGVWKDALESLERDLETLEAQQSLSP